MEAGIGSEAEQPRELDDEGAVRGEGSAAQRRVALIVVHDEELASGPMLPTEPEVGAETDLNATPAAIRARL